VLDRRTLLSRQLKPVAETLGLGNVNWHLLRHSNATLHDSIGTPLGTVQALLGHSSSEITLRCICTRSPLIGEWR
jgi:integrase